MSFITQSGGQFKIDGKRFRFIGVNKYPLLVSTMAQADVTAFFQACQNRTVSVVRTWCFDAGNPPSNSNGNFHYLSGSTLLNREASFQQLDMVLDQARQYGIRLILSLADNPTYNTKTTYINWANSIYGSSLSATQSFFDDTNCRTLYKNNFDTLANRVNTVNGRTYKADDTIFSWELGNELRYDLFTAEGGTQNTINSTDIAAVKAWIIDVAGHMKTTDPNHLIGYGDMGHTWQWVNGDSVSNGSGYGVDYNLFGAISQLDYVDFHLYPTQGDNVHLQEYGQRLGYPNAVSGDGFKAQIRDYVNSAKLNSKPCVMGELGMIRENVADRTYFPLYPRAEAFRNIYVSFFDEVDGDGIILWHGEITDGGTYSINLVDWNGTTTNLNYDDLPVANHINERNGMINHRRIKVI